MCFDVVDLFGFKPGIIERLLQHHALGRTAGRGDGARLTIVINSSALDDGEDIVVIGLCVAQAFKRHHATAFALAESIGTGIEGFAATIRRQRGHLADAY